MSVPAADPFRQSLRRSQERRDQARRRRRWQLRKRSISTILCATMVVGGGAALAAGDGSGSGQAVSVGMLTKGSRGNAVSQVQAKLGVAADGVYGPQTARAVRRFQQANGLVVDGVVGPQTLTALGLGALKLQSAPQQENTGDQNAGGDPGQHLVKIAQCESGGNPRAIGGGGKFRGKYQFTRSSWQAVGGSGDPADASEAEQDRRAQMLYEQQGPGAWPNCS